MACGTSDDLQRALALPLVAQCSALSWLLKTQSVKALGLRKPEFPDGPTQDMITEMERDAAPCDGKHEMKLDGELGRQVSPTRGSRWDVWLMIGWRASYELRGITLARRLQWKGAHNRSCGEWRQTSMERKGRTPNQASSLLSHQHAALKCVQVENYEMALRDGANPQAGRQVRASRVDTSAGET